MKHLLDVNVLLGHVGRTTQAPVRGTGSLKDLPGQLFLTESIERHKLPISNDLSVRAHSLERFKK